MVRMQGLMDDFYAKHPDIKVEWVTLEENVLRQNVTTDIATGGGQYDVITIGTYEVPIWGKQGWLESLNDLPADYDVDDLLPAIRGGLTVDGNLLRLALLRRIVLGQLPQGPDAEKAGITMPGRADLGRHQGRCGRDDRHRGNGIYGICLRGKAGWGENMAFLTTMANSYGARWFDENWVPQFDQPEWKAVMTDYVEPADQVRPARRVEQRLQREPDAVAAGQVRHAHGRHRFGWPSLTDPSSPSFADKVGFALAPDAGLGKRGNWLWAWSLAIPASSDKPRMRPRPSSTGRPTRTTWRLSRRKKAGRNAPPGTRTSLYERGIRQALPFAKMTIDSINAADPTNPTVKPVPYVGVQFVAIPEFAGLATSVGEIFSAALAGQKTVDEALAEAQALAVPKK